MASSFKTDILIIGGGVPGLTLSLLLGNVGINVVLVDPAPLPQIKDIKADGRTAALMQGSLNILRRINVWDHCADISAPLQTLRIIDDKDRSHPEPLLVDFKADEIGMDAFGYNIPITALRAHLAKALTDTKTIRFQQGLLDTLSFGDHAVSASLGDGTEITAKLVIGADGRNSAVRTLAGIDVWERDYGQSAITCLLSHTKSHENISTEFHRPSGPFTLVPMPNKQSSLVWVDKTDAVNEYMAMNKRAIVQAIQDRSRDMLGSIDLVTDPQSWPLKAVKAKEITGHRVALMAEAAHVLSPMGAQGLNLSLRDCAILAETIVDALRLGLDAGLKTNLRGYEAKRSFDINSRVIGSDGLTRMVSNDFGLLKTLRRAGLKTLSPHSPLKTFMMQQGLAPSAEDSRLMQGQAL